MEILLKPITKMIVKKLFLNKLHFPGAKELNGLFLHPQVSLFLAQISGLRDGYNGKIGSPSYILSDPLDTFL